MDFVESTVVRLPFVFSATPEPVIPDVGSVSFSVFDHLGNALLVDEPVTTGATSFQTLLEIPATYNVVPSLARFTRRFVHVTFTVGGLTTVRSANYRLIPNLPMSATAAEVRGFLGVNPYELEDEDVDLISAYFQVEQVLGEPLLMSALTSGTMSELRANEMIRMRAAISIIPSLRHRVAQSEKNGVKAFSRPTIKSFDDLMAAAHQRYDEALGDLIDTDLADQFTLIVVTQDVDPVTGA